MKRLKDELFYTSIFHYMMMLLMAGLFVAGLVFTGSNPNVYDEFVSLNFNNPLTLYFMLLAGAIFFFFCKILYDKVLYKVKDNILLALFMAVGLIIAITYVLTTFSKPQADCLSLSIVASEINAGYPGVYAPDSYIGVYSHQLGFVTVLRLLYKLFGDSNYKAVQLLFTINVPLIMLSGSNIIKIIMKDKAQESISRTRFFYLVITLCCIPMYMYVIFVYGDIAYTGLTMLNCWLLLSGMEKFSIHKPVLFGILCAVEYLCKSNSLIVFLAFGVVLLLSLLNRDRRKASLSLLVSMVLFLILIPKLNDALYKQVMPGTDAMPSIAWVAMGMNDDYERAGWCNFYNQIVFAECGYDGAETKIQCLADIKAVLGVWAHNPGYFLDFINRKINLQWNTPLYQGIVMNNCFDADSQFFMGKAVYQSPKVQKGLENFMKAFQLWMYGSVFAALWINRKDRRRASDYVLLIAVFGGFLFSLIWEAKTRYIFPYLIMILPYFALSLEGIIEKIESSRLLSLEDASEGENKELDKSAYKGLDLFKLILSVFVIAIHTVPYMGLESQLSVKMVEGALFVAVPFFFLTAGFLMGNKLFSTRDISQRVDMLKKYLWKMCKFYLIWSLVYLPLALMEYIKNHYSVKNAVFFYVKGFFFTGEHFNSWMLWYLLSTIFALLLLLAATKLKVKLETTIVIGFGFFIFANFAQYIIEECYYEPKYANLIKALTYSFYICRVFKGLFYFPLGIWLSKHRISLRLSIFMLISGYLVTVWGIFGEVAIVVSSIGLFGLALNIRLKDSPIWKKMRKMSTVIYFMHMWVYTAVYFILYRKKMYNPTEFILTTGLTLIIAWLYARYESRILERLSEIKIKKNRCE